MSAWKRTLLVSCMGALFFALYVLFAGQLSWSELCVALPSAILPTAFLTAQSDWRGRRLTMAPSACFGVAAKALASIPLDAVRVGRLLLLSLVRRRGKRQGMLQIQPFRQGTSDNPGDAGRRALVTLGLSLAPNGYVLDTPAAGGLLVHRLQPLPPAPNQEWPA